jgi:ferric-dicitrate binding protein FerR (iron transport regulator)
MENHTDIETLLTKYFEGKTTPPENEQIEAWLNADEEHLHIARQLNTLYLAVDTQHITKKIDTEKALDKVKSRTKVRNLSWWGWTQRIAAILSVPLLIGVLKIGIGRVYDIQTAFPVVVTHISGI